MEAAGRAEDAATRERYLRWELDQLDDYAAVTDGLIATAAAVEADRQAEREAWQGEAGAPEPVGRAGHVAPRDWRQRHDQPANCNVGGVERWRRARHRPLSRRDLPAPPPRPRQINWRGPRHPSGMTTPTLPACSKVRTDWRDYEGRSVSLQSRWSERRVPQPMHSTSGRGRVRWTCELTYPDRRRAVLEVTSHAGEGVRQNYAVLGRDRWTWPNPGKWFWSADVGNPRDIPRLRQVLRRTDPVVRGRGRCLASRHELVVARGPRGAALAGARIVVPPLGAPGHPGTRPRGDWSGPAVQAAR